ncbi:unnamed protein product [Closterium sp. NIES-53]
MARFDEEVDAGYAAFEEAIMAQHEHLENMIARAPPTLQASLRVKFSMPSQAQDPSTRGQSHASTPRTEQTHASNVQAEVGGEEEGDIPRGGESSQRRDASFQGEGSSHIAPPSTVQREASERDDEYGSGVGARERGDGFGMERSMRRQIGEGSGRVDQVGVEGVGFESYTIGAPPLRRLATNSHPLGAPVVGRSHLFGENIVPPRASRSQMGAAPAGSMGRTGHGMQSSGVMRCDRMEVVEQRTYGQDGGTQRSVQLPRPSTIPTLFDLSPREYTEEDKDRLSRKMVGAAVDKAFTTTPFDGTNFREWALQFRMNARVTNLWEFFVTLQYPVTMAEGNMRDAMERLENLQADYSQRATLAFWVLLHSVSATIQLQLDVFQESYSSTFEAWEYLMETYQAKDSVAKASLQKQLDNLKMGNRATAIRDKLALVGKMVDEDSFTLNLITGLPPHWEELRHSAMLHDISDSYTLQRMMIQEHRYQDLISKTNRDKRPLHMADQARGDHSPRKERIEIKGNQNAAKSTGG